MDFKTNVENALKNAGPDVDREELLVMIFKSTIAQFLEWYIINKGNGSRLPSEALLQSQRQLISEFRDMKIDNQKSVEWYENLFNTTIKEIFNDASLAHKGEDKFEYSNQQLQVNGDLYQQSASGLYLPK